MECVLGFIVLGFFWWVPNKNMLSFANVVSPQLAFPYSSAQGEEGSNGLWNRREGTV